MPSPAMKNVMRQIRGLVARPGPVGQTDEDLLDRFIRSQDEESFSTLVRRHGSLVLGVCLRLLHHRQDAEDAFQATFLTLARKGHTIRQRGALSSWLYRVAFRIALRHKARACYREAPESLGDVPVNHDPSVVAGWGELQPVLDQEMQRLPLKYRMPLVLCYLEGKTYEEAAATLGCPKGTVAIRLLRGRAMLKDRLARRGLMAAASCLAAIAVVPGAHAAVSPVVVSSTVSIAGPAAAGVTLGALVPSSVAALVDETCRGLWLQKVKTVCATVACLVMSGFSAGGGVLSLNPELLQGPGNVSAEVARMPQAVDDTMCVDMREINVRICVVQLDLTEEQDDPHAGVFDPDLEPARSRQSLTLGITASGLPEAPNAQRGVWFPRDDGLSVFLLLNPNKALSSSRPTTGLAMRGRFLDDEFPDRVSDDVLAALAQKPAPPQPLAKLSDVRAIVFTESTQVKLFAGVVRIIVMTPSHFVKTDQPNFFPVF